MKHLLAAWLQVIEVILAWGGVLKAPPCLAPPQVVLHVLLQVGGG